MSSTKNGPVTGIYPFPGLRHGCAALRGRKVLYIEQKRQEKTPATDNRGFPLKERLTHLLGADTIPSTILNVKHQKGQHF